MTAPIVADVIWVFNPTTRSVEIVADGVILETTTIAQAAARVTFHRSELAKANPVATVEASAYRKHNRGGR